MGKKSNNNNQKEAFSFGMNINCFIFQMDLTVHKSINL